MYSWHSRPFTTMFSGKTWCKSKIIIHRTCLIRTGGSIWAIQRLVPPSKRHSNVNFIRCRHWQNGSVDPSTDASSQHWSPSFDSDGYSEGKTDDRCQLLATPWGSRVRMGAAMVGSISFNFAWRPPREVDIKPTLVGLMSATQ
jgi:hypothetical protein